jgi:hypothetical protein
MLGNVGENVIEMSFLQEMTGLAVGTVQDEK